MLPGAMVSILFMFYIFLYAVIRPEAVTDQDDRRFSWKDRFTGLIKILPTAILIFWSWD